MSDEPPLPQVSDLQFAHLRRNIQVDPGTGCWLWVRSRGRDGYGWASLKNKTYQAHRLIYVQLRGEPPAGMLLDHLCRVRYCVNPTHLEPVSNWENLKRGNTPTGWDNCQRCGGPYERLHGQRRCVPCQRKYERSKRTRRAAD